MMGISCPPEGVSDQVSNRNARTDTNADEAWEQNAKICRSTNVFTTMSSEKHPFFPDPNVQHAC